MSSNDELLKHFLHSLYEVSHDGRNIFQSHETNEKISIILSVNQP